MAMIGELAKSHPIQVSPDTPAFEAARRMAEFGIGDVIVADADTRAVVGIVTDRDLALRVVAPCLDPTSTPVGDVCTRGVITIAATDDVDTAEKLMRNSGVRRLPVVRADGTLAGVVSITDLADSGYVADDEFRDVVRSVGNTRRANPVR